MLIRWPTIKTDTLLETHRKRFTCLHENAEIRKKINRAGAIMIAKQCINCGARVGTSLPQKNFTDQEIEKLFTWDDNLSKAFWECSSAAWEETNKREKKRAFLEWESQYNAYLRTEQWAEKRSLVMLRAQGVCEGCRINRATQVHHLSYEHCGEEFLFELVAICTDCHKRIHSDNSLGPSRPVGNSYEIDPTNIDPNEINFDQISDDSDPPF